MKSILKGLVLSAVVAVALFAAGQAPAHADGDADARGIRTGEISREGAEGEMGELRPFARLKLENGNAISFFEIAGDGESVIGMLEEGLPGNPSALSSQELAGKNALEVFNAFAAPGTAMPDQLTAKFGNAGHGQQGWLSASPAPAAAGANMCSTSAFDGLFESFGAPIWDSHLVRLNERPVDHPERWTHYTETFGLPGDGMSAYRYKAQRNNVELYYTMVAVCGLDYHPTYCATYGGCWSHVGPQIIFRYTTAQGQTGVAYIHDVPANGIGSYYSWFFYTGTNWDWSTEIKLARPYDKFNIGLAWKD